MPITRDEVAHLAYLARLALEDAELDHLAAQLDVIISAVARVQEVTAEGIPATSHAVPLTNVFRRGRARPVPEPGGRARGRPRRRGAAVPCPQDPGGGLR